MKSKRQNRVLFRVVALVIGLAVSVGLLEATARLLPLASDEPAPSECRAGPTLTYVDLAKPNIVGCHKGVAYRTNRLGLRSPSLRMKKPRGTLLIVVIGDSVPAGQGVEVESAYPSLLEQRLSARHPERRFEVVNLGHGGHSLAESLHRLRSLGLRLDPDLLVYGFTLNDLEGDTYRYPEVRNRRPFASSPSHLVRLAGPRIFSLVEAVWPPPSSYARELDDNYFRNPEVWQQFERDLDELAEMGERRGICVVSLIHTHLFSLHPWHPFARHYEAVATAMQARGILTVQSLPAFSGRDPMSLWVGPHDWHPNAEGHTLLASTLLAKLDTLAERCRLRI